MMRVESTISGTVSVILPCYNVAPYLDQCLESLVKRGLTPKSEAYGYAKDKKLFE